jgi:hypothetical protein
MMVTAFWDSYGILLIDYLEKGKSITGVYYASLLDKLKAELRQRDRIRRRRKFCCPLHTSAVAIVKMHEQSSN